MGMMSIVQYMYVNGQYTVHTYMYGALLPLLSVHTLTKYVN